MADILNRRDIDFLLHDWLKVDKLLTAPRFAEHSAETVGALIDLAEKLAEDRFLNHYKLSDQVEPRVTAAGAAVIPEIAAGILAFAEAGMFAAPFDEALGGLQYPQLVYQAAMAHFMAANVATAAYPMLTTANARLIAKFGAPAQIEAFVLPAIEGRHLGTMCLSEPDAGSSLADIRTRAAPDGENRLGKRYRVFGAKMWISGGEHDITANIVHLVLAKITGPDGRAGPGTKAISLFIVPKLLDGPDGAIRNDVVLAGLNHKMGYRGTVNTLLAFGEGAHRPFGEAGAVGYLVGETGQGLPQMFQMMNEARISVGLGAAALGYRGFRLALRYAGERRQGRHAGQSQSSPPVALIEHADIKRQLLTQKAYAEGALALVLYCSRLMDETTIGEAADRERAEQLLGLLTPVAKTWPSEYGLAANDIAIQIHGGYGYTRDFDVEQLYRDNRLNPIHEGTTGIQALDLLGRKILRDKGGAYARLREAIDATIVNASLTGALADLADQLRAAESEMAEAIQGLIDDGDAARALWNATPFLSAFGHLVVAWLWLDQAGAACEAGPDDAFREGKLRACRHFFETELPRTSALLRAVRSYAATAATMPPDAF